MKHAGLLLLLLLPMVLVAQDRKAGNEQDANGSIDLLQKETSYTRYDLGAAIGPARPMSEESAFGMAPASSSDKTKTAANKPSDETKRPKTAGSMVGYIDDGIVGSQVRIRFDAGFNDERPDLAEFFYAKCSCYKLLGPLVPAAFDPNPPGPGTGVPKTLNFQQLYLTAEYAPHARFSAFVEVPFRWIQPQGFLAFTPFSNMGGLSDIRAGVKVAMLASSEHYLTFQFKTYIPSGDASKGLGTNHWSLEPSLLYYQKLSDRASLESEIGDWHPTSGSAGVPFTSSEKYSADVIFYGIGPSYEIYRGEKVRFAPVVELVGWNVRGGFETFPGGPLLGVSQEMSGTNIVNLKVGARTSYGNHSSFYVGFGHKLTHADWYQDIVRVEYRYSF